MKTPLKKRDKIKKTDFSSIVKLLKFAKPYLPLIIIALIFSLIQIAATLLVPVVIGRTIDYIVGENNVDFGVIFKNAGILGGLIAVVFLFQYLGSVARNKA